jgi:hypothetical protein
VKVSIEVEFEVEAVDDGNKELLEAGHAESAAELAVTNFLSFCEISGYAVDTDAVEVYVDGFGKCAVKLAEN